MTDENRAGEPAGIRPQDIYFVLFRRKWVILVFSAAGLIAAGALYPTVKPLYQSEAKLLLKYVQESPSVSAVDKEAQIRSPDSAGENIIHSEIEILSSLDLA